jgi:hypothetical protein
MFAQNRNRLAFVESNNKYILTPQEVERNIRFQPFLPSAQGIRVFKGDQLKR